MKHKYHNQIQTLIKVNNTHVQKQEKEILRLVGKKNRLILDLDEKDKSIVLLVNQKNHFKLNYFNTLPSKIFSMHQVHFFRNTLEIYESRIVHTRSQKEKIQKDIDAVDAALIKHRAALKKYSFKNEKYDVLRLEYAHI